VSVREPRKSRVCFREFWVILHGRDVTLVCYIRVSKSGSVPNAATRLQDFRSLVVEMRASLLPTATARQRSMQEGAMNRRSRDTSDYWRVS
jgi:hypothetical protein